MLHTKLYDDLRSYDNYTVYRVRNTLVITCNTTIENEILISRCNVWGAIVTYYETLSRTTRRTRLRTRLSCIIQ
jgi:hypothetical protein